MVFSELKEDRIKQISEEEIKKKRLNGLIFAKRGNDSFTWAVQKRNANQLT